MFANLCPPNLALKAEPILSAAGEEHIVQGL
jgi:hypothetical protein